MSDDQKWQLDLPWPPKQLSPNARNHWAKKSTIAKRYRYQCWAHTVQAANAGGWNVFALKKLVEEGATVHLFIDFYPPDRRGRDDDNIIASFKSGRDGLADGLRIDDKHFRLHPFVERDEPVKGGLVRVTICHKPNSTKKFL